MIFFKKKKKKKKKKKRADSNTLKYLMKRIYTAEHKPFIGKMLQRRYISFIYS